MNSIRGKIVYPPTSTLLSEFQLTGENFTNEAYPSTSAVIIINTEAATLPATVDLLRTFTTYIIIPRNTKLKNISRNEKNIA